MKCPRDGTKLARIKILGAELDKCHKCDGIWFDRGELEHFRDAAVADIEEVLEKKYGDPEYEEGTVDGHMRCPRCEDGRLMRHNYTYINPVAVDRCNKCLGIWLDDGELNAIIGEKQELDNLTEPGRFKSFMRAMARAVGRQAD